MPDDTGAAAHRRDHARTTSPGRWTPPSRIGDDFIQQNLGSGRVDQNSFTHGSSEQRQKWFTTGYQTGDPNQCDTFGTDDLG